MTEPALRPPAVPLIAHDPYFSVWSAADKLTDSPTRHWTGAGQPLAGLIRIDGAAYRWMGPYPPEIPAMEQTDLDVWPTRTVYAFEAAGIRLTVTFLTPSDIDPLDLEPLSRPVGYVAWDAVAIDGGSHEVEVYLDAAAALCVNTVDQKVVYGRARVDDLQVLRMGSRDQRMLERAGDDLRIDWGYLYLAAADAPDLCMACVPDGEARAAFLADGALPASDDLETPRAASDRWPALVVVWRLGQVAETPVSRHAMLAYDDIYSLEYFEQRVRPFWRQGRRGAADLLASGWRDFPAIRANCEAFDERLMAELTAVGGAKYARLCALAYRQCLAAHKMAVTADGRRLYFSKENFSNGCIDTVDVTYPSAPFFLCFAPDLLKAQIGPILEYAASQRWPFPFAPHDLGTYPLANGQVYGGGEESDTDQMPVEECGNMLILTAALAHVEGNADFAAKHWPTLTQWAEYLTAEGMDPENQLCTDDFAGHMAHNANLSIKAILGIAGYARLCEKTGHWKEAASYRAKAQEMAAEWVKRADDGDHYRLAFDAPGTWSQKYNLVWDTILDLNVFPPEVARKEAAFYHGKLAAFGLPLDSRRGYTKTDWELWTATLGDNPALFQAIVDRVYNFANATPNRVAFSDWYETADARQVGFVARSVIGGLFLPLLKAKAKR
ncbi:MAG TPA: DUF4965 domain-containing protein [Armatimonadota bacterium]|jgi:hypothetical protein